SGSAAVPVSVTGSGGVSDFETERSSILEEFYFLYGPTVESVTPSSGFPAGGTTVTIHGKAFESKRGPDEIFFHPEFVKAVKFGSTNATSVEVHKGAPGEEPYITAVAPAGTGTADVSVETWWGTSPASPADKVTYQAVPMGAPCKVEVRPTSARLCGTVTPDGLEVNECKFEYGETAAYGKTAPCAPPPGSGTSPVEVHAEGMGLTPNTTYH